MATNNGNLSSACLQVVRILLAYLMLVLSLTSIFHMESVDLLDLLIILILLIQLSSSNGVLHLPKFNPLTNPSSSFVMLSTLIVQSHFFKTICTNSMSLFSILATIGTISRWSNTILNSSTRVNLCQNLHLYQKLHHSEVAPHAKFGFENKSVIYYRPLSLQHVQNGNWNTGGTYDMIRKWEANTKRKKGGCNCRKCYCRNKCRSF